jgi:hypothetical protein
MQDLASESPYTTMADMGNESCGPGSSELISIHLVDDSIDEDESGILELSSVRQFQIPHPLSPLSPTSSIRLKILQ